MSLDDDARRDLPDTVYKPRNAATFGNQLVALFFGGPTCGFCNRPAFKAALRRLPLFLQREAADMGLGFHWVGVAVEWDVAQGLDYLADVGPFDEVSAGGNWWNTSVAQRLFRDAPPAVPTVALFERRITVDTGRNTLTFGVERQLAAIVGSREIEDWVAQGAPAKHLLMPSEPRPASPAT